MNRRKRSLRRKVKVIDNLDNIINRLSGVNGKLNFITKRYKDDDGTIQKKLLVFLEVPVTKNHQTLYDLIKSNKLDESNLSKGKITLEDTEISGIKILRGIITIKTNDKKKTRKIKMLLDKLMDIFFSSNI